MKVVETIYHKGAHGTSNSRKGYGHLVETQVKLQALAPIYQII